jgi:hypothetical protein
MQKMKLPTVCCRFLVWRSFSVAGSIFLCLFSQSTGSLAIVAPDLDRADKISLAGRSSPPLIRVAPQLIAGADNFNPTLKLRPPTENIPIPPPPAPPTPPTPPTPTPTSGGSAGSSTNATAETSAGSGAPFMILEELKPNIQNNWNNAGQVIRIIEKTATFRLKNGDRLFFTTGYNSYEQSGAKTVTNIPLHLDWETKVNSLKFRPGIGVDLLGGSTTPNFNLKVDYPVTPGLTLSADLEQGAYKFNAKTIENQVSAFRYGPSIFWQIDEDTSLFSSLKLGSYSDSNQEQQSFSRIERKIGAFSVAGNLFTWNYQNSTDKGYFTPPDFLVYSGELGWGGEVIQNVLNCKLSITIGQQHVNAKDSDAGGYQTKCTAKISPNLEADFGYSFSNVKNTVPIVSNANSQSITTQIRLKF